MELASLSSRDKDRRDDGDEEDWVIVNPGISETGIAFADRQCMWKKTPILASDAPPPSLASRQLHDAPKNTVSHDCAA